MKLEGMGVFVPVSERALVQRIERRLRKSFCHFRATRPGSLAERTLGRFYVVDDIGIVQRDVDLAAMGKKLSVLKDYEHLVSS